MSGIRRSFLVAVLFLLLFVPENSQSQRIPEPTRAMGSLQEELVWSHEGPQSTDELNASDDQRLSPLRAGLYSIVVPGAGQLYEGRYWEAAGFAIIEAGLWAYFAHNKSNGLSTTDAFEAYADERWSAVRYADWMQLNYTGKGVAALDDALSHVVTDRASPHPWTAVDWSMMNYCESEIAKLAVPGAPNGFTHILPVRPAQQYYELIGKYPQYCGGWDDAWNGAVSLYSEADVLNSNVSPHFLYYRDRRGEANEFYNNATAAAYILVANHVFSALEAAWAAARHNRNLKIQGSLERKMRQDGHVEMVPTAHLQLQF